MCAITPLMPWDTYEPMGSDGKQGAAWIKAQGGSIFTEAEETCVVYGMPRSVVEVGLSDKSVPLHQMATAILEVL